ncbi:endonuclease/exonuclease/phosphatase family protein [Pontibacter sp. E15-1]|uniref:endonuclease/exonuclease/phosphatase family protein n=1 Tax=Pontibacter sp. E15-1 TaxID=2919918 RepID=UPI001F502CA3|nr:endonuclease/exonuclease/phosphatase family protein [Pontibacter sp. E15-1]MCJ8165088.1 endonuclease/exonuclease/phosphatase family protein [Pontibacter sp. E15-1]
MLIFKKSIYYIALVLGTLLILITLLSLIYDVRYWYLKALDFPRVQVLVGLVFCLVAFASVNRLWRTAAWLFTTGLVTAIVLQGYFVWPYTPLAANAVATANASEVQKNRSFSVLLANVLMKNRNDTAMLQAVTAANPDIVLFMETDAWWVSKLRPIEKRYPYTVLHPLDNTYGMALYSKLPLSQTEVKFLSQERVPSIHTTVTLPNGTSFLLHAVHPVPPKPSKHPDNVGQKEEELLKVGQMVAKRKIPTVVAGDFNDVAWSNTSRLFGTSSRLGDVRIGRGLYNSFDATSPILRWPLDHAYVSEEFEVLRLEQLPKVGSDHFPILVVLTLKQEAAAIH